MSYGILVAKAQGSYIKWMNRIQKAKLIILDDFGLQALNSEIRLALLQILEDRSITYKTQHWQMP